MPAENRKSKKKYPLWERFNQTLIKYISHENHTRKIKNSEDFLLNTKQVFSRWSLESFSGEYGRWIWILGFQFEPVPAKRSRPSYNDGNDQDNAEARYDRLSSQE